MSKEQIAKLTKCLCDIERKGLKCNVCERICEYHMLAVTLYNAGCRLATDVAREIFEELELKAPFFCENQDAYDHFKAAIAELKTKYLGETL